MLSLSSHHTLTLWCVLDMGVLVFLLCGIGCCWCVLQAFRRLGIQPPVGVLMYGVPGTGKTLLAKAVATDCAASFMSLSIPNIVKGHVGESEKALAAAFRAAVSCRFVLTRGGRVAMPLVCCCRASCHLMPRLGGVSSLVRIPMSLSVVLQPLRGVHRRVSSAFYFTRWRSACFVFL